MWNICGKIQSVRFNEAGTIVSYDIMLENGNLTTRHRRYLARDIPEKVVDEAEAHVDIPIHEEVSESEVQTDRVV